MNSIDLLLNRQSNPFLGAPAPSVEQLDIILKAGMKAPDHGALIPWRFIIAKEQGLNKLSQLFSQVMATKTDNAMKLEKAKNMPYRAPMMIIVVTRYQAHDKVPKPEQLVAAGCATHAMQMAAYAQGLGAIWRTGDFSYDDDIKTGLNIAVDEDIVGFLYIGTPTKNKPYREARDYQDFVTYC